MTDLRKFPSNYLRRKEKEKVAIHKETYQRARQ